MRLKDLEFAYTQLRHAWPQRWPGLPRVWQGCVTQFAGSSPNTKPVQQALMAGAQLAQVLENHGQRLGDKEPAYHNRLHTAHTLVALTVFLRVQRELDGRAAYAPLVMHEALMLLAMLGHDAWHDGTRNRFAFELEARSAAGVLNRMAEAGLSAAAQAEVKALILATEPHQRLGSPRGGLRSRVGRATMLREADILSSALPRFARASARALASEWDLLKPGLGQRVLARADRLRFLREMAQFKSPAAQALGLDALVKRQLND